MVKCPAVVGGVAALLACSSPEDMSEQIGIANAPSDESAETPAQLLERRLADDAEERVIEVENEGLSFSYSWPAQAAAIEGLNAQLEQRAAADRAKFEGYASEAQADAEKYDYPFRPFSFSKGWEIAADLPGFLSLGGGRSTYTGGAHGNSDYDTLVWDRAAEQVHVPQDLFKSPAALEAALREPYCTDLKELRAERIGSEFTSGGDIFESCPALSELAVVLASTNGKTFDRIDLIAAPYVAGSYAEGPYIVELPVTDAVRQAVKPDYKDAFTASE